MLLCVYNLVSSWMSIENGGRILNDAYYRIHTSPEHVMVSIPCDLIDRLFQKGNNLTIIIRFSPESSPSPFYKSGPRPRWSWCEDEELYPSDQTPPTYQDVMDGRIKSYCGIMKCLSWRMVPWLQSLLKCHPLDPMWELRRR